MTDLTVEIAIDEKLAQAWKRLEESVEETTASVAAMRSAAAVGAMGAAAAMGRAPARWIRLAAQREVDAALDKWREEVGLADSLYARFPFVVSEFRVQDWERKCKLIALEMEARNYL